MNYYLIDDEIMNIDIDTFKDYSIAKKLAPSR